MCNELSNLQKLSGNSEHNEFSLEVVKFKDYDMILSLSEIIYIRKYKYFSNIIENNNITERFN